MTPTPEALAQKIEALMAKIRHNCVHASHWVICSVCVRIALTEQAQESAADRVRLGLVAEKLKDEIDNRQAEAATTLLTHIYQEDWDYFAARPTLMDAIGAHVRLAFVEQAQATWEAAAKIADRITVLMGERDDATGAYPNDDTLGAVACGVNIAAEIRAAAQGTP